MKFAGSALLLKALSPRMIAKAAMAFDRATLIIVGVAWAVAVVMVGFTLYTVHLSLVAKQDAETMLVTEPVLPKIVKKNVEVRDVQPIIDRLQHIYPDIGFNYRDNLTVTSSDGAKFHEWLTSLGYIDTITPQFHWVLKEFCVGKCGSKDLMRAVLTGEKISFEVPQVDTKR